MFRIQPDNKIQLTKGDTATMKVSIVDNDGNQYGIKDTDVITMTVKETPNSVSPSLVKTATSGVIIINSSDTSSLTSGLYVYEVTLLTNNNTYTIVPLNYFELEEEL